MYKIQRTFSFSRGKIIEKISMKKLKFSREEKKKELYEP